MPLWLYMFFGCAIASVSYHIFYKQGRRHGYDSGFHDAKMLHMEAMIQAVETLTLDAQVSSLDVFGVAAIEAVKHFQAASEQHFPRPNAR